VKFDKETIIAFIICVALLFAWTPVCKKLGWIPEEKPPAAQPQEKTSAPVATNDNTTSQSVTDVAAKQAEPGKTAISVPKTLGNIPAQSILNKYFTMTIDPASGTVKSVVLDKFVNYAHTGKVTFDKNLEPGALAVFNSKPWKMLEIIDNNRSSDNSFSVVRKMADEAGNVFLLTQSWKIVDDYITDYAVTLKNNSDSQLKFEKISINNGGLQPLLHMAGDVISSETHCVDYITVGGNHFDINADAKDKDFFIQPKPDELVKWTGVGNKYFACMLLPEKPFDGGVVPVREETVVSENTKYFTTAVGGSYKNVTVEPRKELVFKFKYYSGPKVMSELKAFDESTTKIMHLSSVGPLDWIAKMMLLALIMLKGLCGSYGWSIIILTIIVRIVFWPVTQKANNSMKKMQKLQPKVVEIKEKFKDNPQQMNAKVMELYKIEKVNPLGGCLPILLQIPVFFALYATLDGAVELRQVAFLWAGDLSRPDTIAVIFGIPLNPLVLVMTALMVLQQKMTPAPADPMQQKMMMFMPVVMLFVLYSLPSGLTLYWTVSQIFSILQLYITQRTSRDEPAADQSKKNNLKKA
jgi:YidC/Oxa1 family membrane protein insertase